MICKSCGSITVRIEVVDGVEHCSKCSGIKESGGAKTDGILTRNSFRVRRESIKREGDFIPPHKYSKESRKVEVNPDFKKRYPDQAKKYKGEK